MARTDSMARSAENLVSGAEAGTAVVAEQQRLGRGTRGRVWSSGPGGLWLSVDEGHVTAIAVAPEYRGRGIGELVLNGLVDQAISLNADMLTLEVRVSNLVAQQLYLKYGFRPAGTRPRYYTDNSEDALIMWTESIHSTVYQDRLYKLRAQLFERLRMEAGEPPPAPTGPGPLPSLQPPRTAE